MTTTRTTTPAPAPADPVGHYAGIPVYAKDSAPETFLTLSQLRTHRLKPADGQRPAAYLRLTVPHTGTVRIDLYDRTQAQPMAPLTPRQREQYQARRTCILCGSAAAHPMPEREGPHLPQRGRICDACDRGHADRHARTCRRCGTEFLTSASVYRALCEPCTDARRHGQAVADRLALRHCPDCTTQTATRDDITTAQAADPYSLGLMSFPRICPPCQTDRDHRAAERRRADERARWDELGPVRAWARDVVARPHAYAILDTETTGLDSDARVVEISITDGAGTPLLDTLINPGMPIPDDARAVHGISDQDVATAQEFGDALPRITRALAGRQIIIYNRGYDTGVLAYELDHHHRRHTPTLPGMNVPDYEMHPAAVEWMDAQDWGRCAMLARAVHIGEWSSYHQSWKWPRLDGGHRALGDCRRVVEIVREMAAAPDPF
ncbi:exonuclease domain-containing protein [Streptomyces sp. NPDC001251]